MSTIVIEPHYLGSLEYYALLGQHENVVFEVNDKFKKQTFRNRCYVLGANSIQALILPLRHSNGMLTKEVALDHSQRWKKDHWGAFYSSYGKAPFFEYFSDMFSSVWDKKHKYLIDINHDFIELTFKLLQSNVNLTYTDTYEIFYENDFRDVILPKKAYADRKIYTPQPYTQLFGDTFEPNLSIVDLILCEGPQAGQVLAASFLRNQN